MASVTGMTVAKLNALLDEMVVGIRLDGGFLIYERRNGSEENAGALTDPDLAVNAAYPVNSIYTSTVPTNPGDPGMLGIGTWIRFGKGRVLVSQDDTVPEFDTTGEEGGVKEVTLTTAQIPTHDHNMGHTHPVSNTDPAGYHQHSIAVKYRADLEDDTADNGQAITGVGGANHGPIPGADTGVTSYDGVHAHTMVTQAFVGNTSVAGSGGAHTNLQPYIVVYIWKRTA